MSKPRNFNRDGNLGRCRRVETTRDGVSFGMGCKPEMSNHGLEYVSPLERRVDAIMRARRPLT